MNKEYLTPQVYIKLVDKQDVICTSPVGAVDDDNLTKWDNVWSVKG